MAAEKSVVSFEKVINSEEILIVEVSFSFISTTH
jgi:hypothetical protein